MPASFNYVFMIREQHCTFRATEGNRAFEVASHQVSSIERWQLIYEPDHVQEDREECKSPTQRKPWILPEVRGHPPEVEERNLN